MSFVLPEAGQTRIIIYDQMGGEVARLVNGYLGAGYHTASWDAKNVALGIYFYHLQAGDFIQTRKMVLLK
ncbi:T9SS type A sorting domain-containing protein [Candidatus Marinimicrobia bacterium MT.SAG.3]|nr:T9SS type A sorting domain-containing protein [Candidatus Marinimicrobia bacterium MT.SAG.3]